MKTKQSLYHNQTRNITSSSSWQTRQPLFSMKPTPMASSTFTCELTILQAKNTSSIPDGGDLFVRFYLSAAGKKQRIHLDTRSVDIPASACSWDETFSLQCSGDGDSIQELKQESVIFELRQRRRRRALLGGSSSKLLGTAEFPWRTGFEAPCVEIELWVPIIPKASLTKDGEKPPSIRVAMKIKSGAELPTEVTTRQERRKKREEQSKCGCRGSCDQPWGYGCGAEYYDAFVVAAAFEAF